MKTKEILYSNLINSLKRITENEEYTDSFYENISKDNQAEYADLLNEISNEKESLKRCRREGSEYENTENLFRYINQFNSLFPSFTELNFKIIELLIHLIGIVIINNDIDFESEIDVNIFHFLEVTIDPNVSLFIKEHTIIENSIVYISTYDQDYLSSLVNCNASSTLILHLINSCVDNFEIENKKLVLIHHSIGSDQIEKLNSYLFLNMISEGKSIMRGYTFNFPPVCNCDDELSYSVNYSQFHEILLIISEYNYHKDLYTKYLTIYQIIENFMYKFQIVKLEKQSNGRMFSIRDFKRLYKAAETNEMKALTDLFHNSLNLNINGNILKDIFKSKWDLFMQTLLNQNDFEDFARNIGISSLSNPDFVSLFTSLVYKLRCSIVHNKETEYHLIYANITPDIESLFNTFLLPTLEEYVFYMIGIQNDYIWYQNQELLLWK